MSEDQKKLVAVPGNMELWNKVCETDPAITREVRYGKRKFTAIDAQSQIKMATELWGPYGGDWALDNLKWGAVLNPDGSVIELTLDAVFRAPDILFEISSDIKYSPGGECRKKLQTDVLTKALSRMGFNSDVFEGRFDDNRYVQEMKKKAASKGEEPPEWDESDTPSPPPAVPMVPDVNEDDIPLGIHNIVMENIEKGVKHFGEDHYRDWLENILRHTLSVESGKVGHIKDDKIKLYGLYQFQKMKLKDAGVEEE